MQVQVSRLLPIAALNGPYFPFGLQTPSRVGHANKTCKWVHAMLFGLRYPPYPTQATLPTHC